MDRGRLITVLTPVLGATLADELTSDFLKLRHDAATGTLERASSGKFVETFVQCLQYMATGAYDAKPSVDLYLGQQAENQTALPEGLRICAARLARTLYTLRNKRNIAHKNPVDPNKFDLALAHEGAAWIMAELLRNASGTSMHEAGVLIELLQTPVGTLVEEIDGTRLVHAVTSIRGEVLILLHSHFPERASQGDIIKSLSARSPGSVRNRLAEMCKEKLLHGTPKTGYRLTAPGYNSAVDLIAELQNNEEAA